MNELNNKLDSLGLIMVSIDVTMRSINNKLDELIKALHEYDDDLIYEPNEALLAAAEVYNEEVANKRMDVIGQNGNTGEHYENEIINKPATINTHNVEKLIGGHVVLNSVIVDKKKRDKRKYYKPKAK